MYSPDKPFIVYCRECWYGDGWDPLQFGREYDFSKPFLEQFRNLMEQVPRIGLFSVRSEIGIDYANFIVGCKNVYLSFSMVGDENVYYSRSVDASKETFDSLNARELEMCYENVDSARNYRSHYLVRSRDCIDSAFLFDCVNCQNCFMSANLRNQRFVFRNRQYSKEEYHQKLAELHRGSAKILSELKDEFSKLMRSSLHKFSNMTKSVNCTGNNIENSKNAKHSFDVYDAEDIKFSSRVTKGSKDVYDNVGVASELLYEGVAGGFGSYGNKCFSFLEASQNVQYSDWCQSSMYLFGCTGLRKKQYCILNKQYSKDEYESLVSKIIQHMNDMPYTDQRGRIYRYGEFFPIELSPFAYNETIAQEYFPLTKEETITQSYPWRDPDPYPHKPTITAQDLPDTIENTTDSILKELIGCAVCGKVYRIIEPELIFLRQQQIALPRKCPECRHKDRFALRNPLKLWHRTCRCAGRESERGTWKNTTTHFHGSAPCPNTFETSYAPERKEIVYCEACYNAEVA